LGPAVDLASFFIETWRCHLYDNLFHRFDCVSASVEARGDNVRMEIHTFGGQTQTKRRLDALLRGFCSGRRARHAEASAKVARLRSRHSSPVTRHFFKSLLVSSAAMTRSIFACLGLQCRLLGSAVGYSRLADFLVSKVKTLISCLVCKRHNAPPDWRPRGFQRDF